MEATFHGAAVITLDAKGRVAVPTRHRGALGKPLVLSELSWSSDRLLVAYARGGELVHRTIALPR